jgi:hypothetical protein
MELCARGKLRGKAPCRTRLGELVGDAGEVDGGALGGPLRGGGRGAGQGERHHGGGGQGAEDGVHCLRVESGEARAGCGGK